MPKYQNIGVDQEAFLAFVESPSNEQLSTFIDLLGSSKHANSWFEEKPPAWSAEPEKWVRNHLLTNDWYVVLSEPEMVAWENAIIRIVDQFNMETAVDLATMEHGAVDFDVFEFAETVYQSRGQKSLVGKMAPYRFSGVSAEIEEVEPWARIFNINHAMLDVCQVEQLIDELSGYETLLDGFSPSYESVFASIEERKVNAINEARDLLGFLSSLVESRSMWYALIDS